MDWHDSTFWLAFGLLGQAAFASRFLVQWVASEVAGYSHVPKVFWYLSIVGSLILLAYAIHRRDPVFTIAYLPNTFIYVRNLVLIHREERQPQSVPTGELAAEPSPRVAKAGS